MNPSTQAMVNAYLSLPFFRPETRYKKAYEVSGSTDDYKTFLKKQTFGKTPGHKGRSSKYQSRDMSYLAKEFGVNQEQALRHFMGGASEVTLGKRKRSRYIAPSKNLQDNNVVEAGVRNLLGLI